MFEPNDIPEMGGTEYTCALPLISSETSGEIYKISPTKILKVLHNKEDVELAIAQRMIEGPISDFDYKIFAIGIIDDEYVILRESLQDFPIDTSESRKTFELLTDYCNCFFDLNLLEPQYITGIQREMSSRFEQENIQSEVLQELFYKFMDSYPSYLENGISFKEVHGSHFGVRTDETIVLKEYSLCSAPEIDVDIIKDIEREVNQIVYNEMNPTKTPTL